MADNVTANAGSGGSLFATALGTWSGDATANFPGCFLAIVSGSEGAWTFSQVVGGAGAVAAGVQRMTLASDDPAVTALQILDNAISGTEMQVDVVAALPAGTNAIGKLAANTGVDIGDVDVTSIIPGTGATNLGKAVDTATGATDTGVLALATRDDALSALTPIEGDNVQLRTDANGALWVIPSGTVTVTGTVTAAQATAANLNATVVGTGTFAVQAAQSGTWNITNVSGTVSLPTGAATAAKQPALGTAGTASTDVITVQGIASMTPILVTLSGTNNVTNAGTFAVQAACTNAGTFAVQVDGAALTALQVIDNPVLVDDAAFTPATSSVMMAGFQADETATDSVDEGDAGAARMTLDRKVIVTPQPHTAGGCAIFRTLDLDETEEDVKTSAGQIYGIFAINTTNAALYLKVYNATAASVVVGTTAPVMTLPVPGNNDTDGAGFWLSLPVGIAFDTAISAAATTGVADADTGAPGANALIVQIFYK